MSTGYLSQGSPTQLYSEAFGSGAITFTKVGAVSSYSYNAISINLADGYLYGIETSPTAGDLLKIDPTTGVATDLGATSPTIGGLYAGTFDATGDHYYVAAGSATLDDVDVSTRNATPITMTSSPGVADFTVVGGMLWGLTSAAKPVRVNPSTGQVDTFAALPGVTTGTYGADFTLGNGDAEFGNNNGGITEVKIGDPTGASPTFTVIATSSSPSSSTNDGAACASAKTHLSIDTSSTATTVAPGGTITWSVTVTNDGPATSSGFTLTDTLPTGYTAGDMSTGCSASGSAVSCTHGELDNGKSATISISATAPTTTTCGTSSVPNTISVQGNEADYDPGAGDTTTSPQVCVTGNTPQTINFAQVADATMSDGHVSVAPTASSGLAVSLTSTTTSVCTVAGTTVTLVAAGICTLDGDQSGDSTYQPAPQIVRSFTISDALGGTGAKQTQQITFPTPATTGALHGPVALQATASSGLAVAYTSISPAVCTISGSDAVLVSPGSCVIDANQAGDATYAAASTVERSFTVSKEPQSIDFTQPADSPLADGTTTIAASATSGLGVTFTGATTPVCTVSGTTVTLVAVGICTVDADQAGNGTYTAAPTIVRSFGVTDGSGHSGSLQTQTITFPTPATTLLSAGTTTLRATADSHLTVSYTSSTPSVCTVTGARATLLAIGTCTIDADQGGNSSYAAASTVVDSFSVAGKRQTISFDQPANTDVGAGPVSLTVSASSGLPVTLTSATSSICTVSGTKATLLTSGVCTIHAAQAGDATYAAAVTVVRSFGVTSGGTIAGALALQAITFPQPTTKPLSTKTTTLAATSDSGLPVSFTAAAPSVCTVAADVVTFVGAGSCVIDADQAGDVSHAPASTVAATFSILAPALAGGTPLAPASVRIGGGDRDATAEKVATTMYPTRSAHVVVLARDDVYADALTGSPLAESLGGPLVLTPTASLSSSAQAAIEQVLPLGGLVICLGQRAAISDNVLAQVRARGYQVERIGGADRYATATAIANRIAGQHAVSGVYLATGQSFADALPAADAAGLTQGIVLLTAGATMPGSTTSWLSVHPGLATSAVGGAAAAADPSATLYVGADRYATSARLAAAVASDASGIVLATGVNFPDGLAGAVFAAHNGWSLLLVSPSATSLDADQADYIKTVTPTVTTVTAIGGTSALPESAVALVASGLS